MCAANAAPLIAQAASRQVIRIGLDAARLASAAKVMPVTRYTRPKNSTARSQRRSGAAMSSLKLRANRPPAQERQPLQMALRKQRTRPATHGSRIDRNVDRKSVV